VIFKRLIILFAFIQGSLASANPFLPFFNKLYKAHQLIENKDFVNSKKIILKQVQSKDSNQCIAWYDLSRIYENDKKFDSALIFSEKALLKLFIQHQKASEAIKLSKRYSLNLNHFNDLITSQVEKLYVLNRKSEPNLLGKKNRNVFYTEHFMTLKNRIEKHSLYKNYLDTSTREQVKNLGCVTQLEWSIEHLQYCEDTIEFKKALASKNINIYKEYIDLYWKNIEKNHHLKEVIHLKNFYKVIEDTLFKTAFELVLIENNEQSYIKFIEEYPNAPQKDSAFNLAENIAYLDAKSANSNSKYETYIKKYPRARHRSQIDYLMRYLNVVPVPYLTKDLKYVYVDSASSETWTDSLYDFAYPYASNYHKKWYSNGSMLVPGCALVMKFDDFGASDFFYIEKDGTPVNQKTYDEIVQFSANMAFVQKADRHGIINSLGQEILPCKFQRIYFDTTLKLGILYNGKSWGMFNLTGKLITPIQYSNILSPFSSITVNVDIIELPKVLIAVINDNLWGYITTTGEKAIEFNYKQAFPFKNGVALVETTNGKWMYIDFEGKQVSKEYDLIQDLDNGFSKIVKIVEGKKKYGILSKPFGSKIPQMNLTHNQLHDFGRNFKIKYQSDSIYKEFKEIIQPIHDDILITNNLHFNAFAIKTTKGYIIYDTVGVIVSKNAIPNLSVFAQKMFITKEKKQVKWYNYVNHLMSNLSFEEINVISDHLVAGLTKGVWNIYQINEKPLSVINDKGLVYKDFEAIVPAEKEGYFMIQKKGVWGLCNENGKVILDCKYHDIYFTDNINNFIVRIPETASNEESSWGVINTAGKFIVDPVFEGISFEDFSGYWLVPYNEKNSWLDQKGNLFAEPIE